jgi:hypothetical protein
MHHAPCTIHHTPCTMHHAPCTCTLRHPPCTPPCTVHSMTTQLRVAHGTVSAQEGRQDLVRTPRRRNNRDRDPISGRYASGSGRYHNRSRSRSPQRTSQRSSPPPYNRHYNQQQSPSKPPVFPSSTAHQGLPACALCLATDPHDTRKCRSETLWDGSKARCRKNDEGRLISPAGTQLCSDWNNRRGCSSNSHEQRHECSGCGNKDHGAQGCPRAQKKPGPHAV